MTITNELIAEKKRTEDTIAEQMAKIRRNAVMLEPDTIAMLDELPIADEDRELIKAWDGVLMPRGCYRTREAVEILNMAPQLGDRLIFSATPWGALVNPKSESRRYLPHRMWKDFWEDAPPADTLRAVIKRVMATLLDERELKLPSVLDAARYLRQTPKLSQIVNIMRYLSEYAALAARRRLTVPSVDEITAALDAAEYAYDRDIRPLASPEELAADPSWAEREWVVCSLCHKAVERGAALLDQATPSGKVHVWGHLDNPTAPILRAHCPGCPPFRMDMMVVREFSKLEELQFRSIGQWPPNTPDVAEYLAYEYNTTAEVVERILAGEEISRRVRREKCPVAADCTTFCGQHQQGDYPRPFTHDGRWQSCDYAHFLRGDTAAALAALREDQGETETEAIDEVVEMFDAVKARGSVQPSLL